MKTKMISNEPRTLEDIVFENRNKDYGAYALNRYYAKYLLAAFLICMAGVSTALAVPFLKSMHNPAIRVIPETGIQVKIGKVDPIKLPPPPPPVPENLLKQVGFSAPLIVEDPPEEGYEIPSMEELIRNTSNIPVPDDISVVGQTPEIDEPAEKEFLHPQEEATFMNGDVNTFRVWVQTNMIYPQQAIEHGIFGRVTVGFCVNSAGQVVDIIVIRGVDPSLDDETVRIISSSPLWKPARQGGVPVKQRFYIPVMFVLSM
jgi:protein TonB